MKKLTVGRDEDCDIVITDHKGLVSRKHALLNVSALGKCEIIDVSKNGTFVNGIRIKPHVPHPVRRKDVVVFANSAKLDWSEVKDNSKILRIITICVCSLLAVLLCIWIISSLTSKQEEKESISLPMPPVMNNGHDESENDDNAQQIIESGKTFNTEDETPALPQKSQPSKKKESRDNDKVSKDTEKSNTKEINKNQKDNSEQTEHKEPESQSNEELKAPGGD